MSEFKKLHERFSDSSLKVRRLLRDDPTFREMCSDYEDAIKASTFWLSQPAPSDKRAQEYRALVRELEAEIDAIMKPE